MSLNRIMQRLTEITDDAIFRAHLQNLGISNIEEYMTALIQLASVGYSPEDLRDIAIYGAMYGTKPIQHLKDLGGIK